MRASENQLAGSTMSPRIKSNFRGYRALLVAHEALNCEHLERTLGRLGVEVHRCSAAELHQFSFAEIDLVIFDADEDDDLSTLAELSNAASLIALIGNEAPSRLSRVVALGCDSHITKPARTRGIYSALVIAANGRVKRAELKEKIYDLNRRISRRKSLISAIVNLMNNKAINENEAYEYLRKEAMSQRISVEDAAEEYLQIVKNASDVRMFVEGRKE